MNAQHTLLEAALKLAPFEGWNAGMLVQAAQQVGISEFETRRSFPGGVAEVLAYFSAQADESLAATLVSDASYSQQKIRERIAIAVLTRLRHAMPHREAIRRAVAFYALPWNTCHGLSALYATVDTIWRAAGDTSTDYNFYSKRVILAGVYTSTLQVWLNDESDDLAITEAFLRRRIENVMQFEKLKSRVKERFG
jgi:ubiquinone biosynthesis protein COQ9